MSRRRYISTEISVDKKIRRLSDAAALLYTWMIPHTDDGGTITGDPEELQAIVVPNRPGWSASKIVKALEEIVEQELCYWDGPNGRVSFPETFFKHQSYITEARRQKACKTPVPAQISAEQRKSAQNSALFSSSSSSSKHMSDKSDHFPSFWEKYPRKQGKGKARESWGRATKTTDAQTILAGLDRHLVVWAKVEPQYIPFPATWLNQERWGDELSVKVNTYEPFSADKQARDQALAEARADFGGE